MKVIAELRAYDQFVLILAYLPQAILVGHSGTLPGMLVLVLVLVHKDSLRTNFKSLSLFLSLWPIVLEKSFFLPIFTQRDKPAQSVLKTVSVTWDVCRGVWSWMALWRYINFVLLLLLLLLLKSAIVLIRSITQNFGFESVICWSPV